MKSLWTINHPDRIQLYSLATPNGQKVSIALEAMQLAYEAHTIDITKGDQFSPEFLALNPNAKIPVIVDPSSYDGKPITIFESGAILLYLAEKTGQLMPEEPRAQQECKQWLFFQMANIGPMFGQFGHFYKYAGQKCEHPYPLERYKNETKRLLKLLDERLEKKAYILGDSYSIADISIFPWLYCLDHFYKAEEILSLTSYKHLNTWLKRCLEKPGTKKGMATCSL